jgi:hypothetical protein
MYYVYNIVANFSNSLYLSFIRQFHQNTDLSYEGKSSKHYKMTRK